MERKSGKNRKSNFPGIRNRKERVIALAVTTLSVPGLLLSVLWASAQSASAQQVPALQAKLDNPPVVPGRAEKELSEAAARAKSTGEPVILSSRTTETSTTAVTPEGKFVTEIVTGPVRVRRPDGGWQRIDTHLMKSGDMLRPRAAKVDVRFSAGGSAPFAQTILGADKLLTLGWPTKLPKPIVEGNKAIYRSVVGSTGDLVATALPTGLRFDVVLRARPTEQVEVRVPITVDGLNLDSTGDQLNITDGSGKLVAVSSKPTMWDAGSSLGRISGHVKSGRLHGTVGGVVGQGRTGEVVTKVESTAGGQVMVLKPSTEFLNDPAVTYPVTVDPSVVLPLNNDTDVNSVFDSNNVSGEYLKAGTESDGEKARVYLRFNTQGLKPPTKAELKLTNIDAPRCGTTVGAGIQVRRVTDFWDAETQTWTPQPGNTTEDAVVSTEGSQLGSCGSGRMSWDVTGIAAKWAAGTAKNHGLVLQSPAENRQANYRVFTSAENTEEFAVPPTLTITSDVPSTPGEGDDPADPGPAPAELRPGQVEPETGSWITNGTDIVEDGLITTRSHSAGQRIDRTQPNENVLGPNWRFEPLGGVLGDRLKDYSANGYIQINLTTGIASMRFLADPARPGTFVSEDGGTVVKNADGTFTQTGAGDGIVSVWSKVGADYLITRIGKADVGTTVVTYDPQGRVIRIASPPTPQDDCVAAAARCASVAYQYATTTTATASQVGDVTGQLKQIAYDAAGDVAPVTAVRYAYDAAKRLREVSDVRQVDGEPITTSSYVYDTTGNITRLNSPELGAWTLTYQGPGKLTAATRDASLALPTRCKYASQFLWGLDGCWAGPVPMAYGATKIPPSWKRTPGRKAVVGVTHDHCTNALDQPSGFDFRPACDMHDYGYGIIYLKTREWDKSKKAGVDSIFYTTLRDYTCNAYSNTGGPISRRAACRRWAWSYYQAVKVGGGGSMLYRNQY